MGKLTPKQLVAMMERYLAGEGPKELSADYGISVGSFHTLRRKMGIAPMQRQKGKALASVVDIEEARRILAKKRQG